MPSTRPPLKPLERSVFGRLSHVILGAWARIQRAWFRWADLNQHAAWFPFFVAAVVAVDAIVVVLPGDVIVALAVLSNAGRWKRLATYAGIGSALGAFVLFMALGHWGRAPLDQLASIGAPTSTVEGLNAMNEGQPDLEGGLAAMRHDRQPVWRRARGFFERYGLFSLALSSVLPLLSWPTVIVAGLSSERWLEALFWLILGRQARYWILCFGVREGWAMFQSLREEALDQRVRRDKGAAAERAKRARRG